MDDDRAVSAFRDLVQGLSGQRNVPAVDHLALYRARVIAQSADFTKVDLQPDDARIPGVGSVPITLGLPGCTVQVEQGAYMLLGWRGGDPAQPYAMPSWESSATMTKLAITCPEIYLAGQGDSDKVLTASDFRTFLKAWSDAVVGGSDGGATMRSNTIAALQAAGWSVGSLPLTDLGSTKVWAQR